MKNYIFLDIETIPIKIEHEDIKQYLMDKRISKEQRVFDPNYSKIVTIGIKKIDEDVKILFGEEKEILKEFWDFMKDNRDYILVTHNGYKFDVPFIILRSCINGVKIPVKINTNRWSMEKSNHFDIMLFFSQYENFTNINLDILGKMHGIEVNEKRVAGREVERLFNENKIDDINEHCRQDIILLEKIFKKICLGYLED